MKGISNLMIGLIIALVAVIVVAIVLIAVYIMQPKAPAGTQEQQQTGCSIEGQSCIFWTKGCCPTSGTTCQWDINPLNGFQTCKR